MEISSGETFLYSVVIAAIVIFCAVAFYVNVVYPFWEDRRYIRSEMKNSYNKDEYRYWKRELKKLYILQIPLLGNFIVKRMR